MHGDESIQTSWSWRLLLRYVVPVQPFPGCRGLEDSGVSLEACIESGSTVGALDLELVDPPTRVMAPHSVCRSGWLGQFAIRWKATRAGASADAKDQPWLLGPMMKGLVSANSARRVYLMHPNFSNASSNRSHGLESY